MRKIVLAALLLLCSAAPRASAYAIPDDANLVRSDGYLVYTWSTASRPTWAALVVSIPSGHNVRLDCGDLAQDRGCFEIQPGDRVLIYGHLRPSLECAYDPPCSEIQVDNIRRFNTSTGVWSLWVNGTGWVPNI